MLEQFFLTLLQRSLVAGVLIMALLLLRPLMFRISRASCCVLWWLVAFRLLCPFSIPSVLSLFGLFEHTNQAVAATPSKGDEIFIWQIGSDAVQGGASTVSKAVTATEILSVLWIMGTVLLVGFWVVSYLRMRKNARHAIIQDGGYWRCDRVRSPMVFGIIHPRILIPFYIEEADIPYILAHEQAHISRRDNLTKPLAFLLVAVYWFNPLVWLAYVLYCHDIEFACDARALRMLGETADVKVRYSRVLLKNSIRPQDRPALSFGGSEVKKRLKFALSYRKPKLAAMLIVALVFTTVAFCFLTDPIVRAEHSAPLEPGAPILSVPAESHVPQPELEASEAETSDETSEDDLSAVRAEIERIIMSGTTHESLRHFKMWWGEDSSDGVNNIVYQNEGTEDGTITLLVAYGGGSYPHFEDYGAELLTIRIPAGETVVCPLDPGYSYKSCGYIIVGSSYGTISHNIFINQDAFRIDNVPLTEYLKNSTHPTLTERTFG